MGINKKTFLASLILGGTALGAGMLGLPVATAGGSFYDDLIVYFLCWAFNLITGVLFVEILHALKEEVNLSTMAEILLGKWGRICSWALYIFLFYCLMIAYISAGGSLVASLLDLPFALSSVLFALFFGLLTWSGTKFAGKVNFFFMAILLGSLLWFLCTGIGKINPTLFSHGNFFHSLWGLGVVFTSFSYQGTVPTIFYYLERSPRHTKIAVFWGTIIPFAAYILWNAVIKGIVPLEGAHGLLQAKIAGDLATTPLTFYMPKSLVNIAGQIFSFFAIATSLIGVSLGLFDFLQDGVSLPKTAKNRIYLCLLIYLPALIISLTYPGIFLTALTLAGGIGGTLLLGFMPIFMVYVGRYVHHSFMKPGLFGGKYLLALLTIFVVIEVLITLYSQYRSAIL